MRPYKQGESKISKKQWERLNTFFQSIERPAQDELYATGDHYTLYLILRNELGFRPPSNAIDVYVPRSRFRGRQSAEGSGKFAEQVLLEGWDDQ